MTKPTLKITTFAIHGDAMNGHKSRPAAFTYAGDRFQSMPPASRAEAAKINATVTLLSHAVKGETP